MNKARDFAAEPHSKGILFETDVRNVHAQAVYESLGYTRNVEGFFYFLDV